MTVVEGFSLQRSDEIRKIPALAVLCEYDTVIVVDDSASMMWENRWQEVSFVSMADQYPEDI